MSRHYADHVAFDETSSQDSAQALDWDDNVLALEQRAERSAAHAVAAFVATAAVCLLCALQLAGVL